jgi:FHA domain-containing protein
VQRARRRPRADPRHPPRRRAARICAPSACPTARAPVAPPPPPSPPPPAAPPPASRPPDWDVSLDVGAAQTFGFLLPLSWALDAEASLRLRRASFGVGALWLPTRTREAPPGVVDLWLAEAPPGLAAPSSASAAVFGSPFAPSPGSAPSMGLAAASRPIVRAPRPGSPSAPPPSPRDLSADPSAGPCAPPLPFRSSRRRSRPTSARAA